MQYVEFMKEYLDLGYMALSESTSRGCFIPHHAVLKLSSSTTTLRVVFDASCKTSNGLSLVKSYIPLSRLFFFVFDNISMFSQPM